MTTLPKQSDLPAPARALFGTIQAAFGDAIYPGDDRISTDSTRGSEGYDINRRLAGHHWRDVSLETLDQLRDSLPLLSPEGFRFYVPAFMIYCVADRGRADVMVDSLIGMFTVPGAADFEETLKAMDQFRASHPGHASSLPDNTYHSVMASLEQYHVSGERERFVLDRISGFTAEQGRAIRRYLEYMRDVHGDDFLRNEPQTAIDRWWQRF